MRKTLPFWLVVFVCAAALVASSLLLVDYVRPAPVFCAADGGCGLVRRTVFAYPLGIPTPLIGIGGLLAIGLAELLQGRRARIVQVMLAAIGAIVGVGLLLVQLKMKTVCPFCAVVDSSAIVLVVLSALRVVKGWDPPGSRAQLAGGVTVILLAVIAPIAFGMSKKAIPIDVPPVIAEEIRKTPRGKVTVVDFVVFECPFCRITQTDFAPLLEAHKDKVRLVRKQVPLRMHAHAMDAARTACCGEKLGKGDEIADALFAAPPAELTPEGCEELAVKHGLDLARFKECFTSAETDARIKADLETFRAAGGHGLPTLYIDTTKLEGAQEPEVLKSVLDKAIRAL